MNRRILTASLGLVALVCSAGAAGPFRFNRDYYSQGGYSYGDSSGPVFEIWEIGARIEGDRLEFSIWTDLPEAGGHAEDSYAPDPLLTIGDLSITVGGRDPFSDESPRYAVALTTHDNVVQQKYPGEVWPLVTKGRLYTDPVFATGTFETYQQAMKDGGYWYAPDDRDGDDTTNSYMTLVKDFGGELTGHSGVTWTLEPYWNWDEEGGWYLQDAYRITGYVELGEIGLAPGMSYSVFISSECGNDAAYYTIIPEPWMIALFGAGLGIVGLGASRRR
ncbi:MAG: hypothetical protein ACOC8E_02445 [Planctomycetota bacterium]